MRELNTLSVIVSMDKVREDGVQNFFCRLATGLAWDGARVVEKKKRCSQKRDYVNEDMR